MPTPKNDPDRAITSSIQRRDYRGALETMASAYALHLGRLCLAMVGNQAEAEELVQEILLAAYSAMPGFEGRSSVRTWLHTIARRTCCRTLAVRNHRRDLLAAAELRPDEPEDPLHLALASGERERLRGALAELSPAQQEVLLLRYVSGLSFREVAQVCSIREEAARQRASTGLRLLRRRMVQVSLDSPQEAVAACQEGSR